MNVRLLGFLFVVCRAGSGLFDRIILRSEESYRECMCVIYEGWNLHATLNDWFL